MKIYKKIARFTNIIQYFTVRNWEFSNTSTKQLLHELDKEDTEMFYFDLKNLDWEDYFENYVKGIRTYLLKEPLKTLPEARKRWNRYIYRIIFIIYSDNFYIKLYVFQIVLVTSSHEVRASSISHKNGLVYNICFNINPHYNHQNRL